MLEFSLQVSGPSSAMFHTAQSFQSCQDSNGDVIAVVTCLDENSQPVDLRGATEPKIAILKPDGSTLEYDAEITTNGMDGRLSYPLDAATDLDQDGFYQIQAKFKISGALKTTRLGGFMVRPNIPAPAP